MRLRYVEIFYAVMQAGTVNGAAGILHLTQPAASRLLQQAERNVGFPLFQRVRGRLVPTAEAQRLFPEVERLFLSLDAVRRMAASLHRVGESLVRVLCVPSLALEHAPRALGHWCQRHATARVSLNTLHSAQIAHGLALREGDIGFVFEPTEHPALRCEPIAQSRIVCVGTDVPEPGVDIQSLAQHPVIDLDPSNAVGRLLHAACRLQGVEPMSRVVAHSYHTAIEMAAQGLGWALVDGFSAAYASRHASLRVRPLQPEVPVTVYCVRPRDLPSSVAVESLVEAFTLELRAAVEKGPAAAQAPALNLLRRA